LFLRTSLNLKNFFFFFRRWFSIRNGQLLYVKRNNINLTNDGTQQQLPYSVMVPDLRLCTIRPINDNDRRFVFEILSPIR
jgi:Arf-GAP/coiled-coil/ANK repeat/PH domain-containing protein